MGLRIVGSVKDQKSGANIVAQRDELAPAVLVSHIRAPDSPDSLLLSFQSSSLLVSLANKQKMAQVFVPLTSTRGIRMELLFLPSFGLVPDASAIWTVDSGQRILNISVSPSLGHSAILTNENKVF